ncbi:MAG: amidoligase family protein [Clostridia bacterium]|nr:amidoligase family protein [Clostridia bacterium]
MSGNNIITCYECGNQFAADEVEFFNGFHMCRSCLARTTVICEECGERIWESDSIDGRFCERCFDENYVHCTNCGCIISQNDAYYTDDDEEYHDCPYCHNCYEHLDTCIHDYYYKPEAVFYGKGKRYFGVELEVDDGGEDSENAEAILDIANSTGEDRMYIKHDGSLDNGFEMVTHPMTLDYHMNQMPWQDIMRKAIRRRYSSHQAGTCGLHVHISRKALGDTYEDQETTIAKILYFYEKFWDEILRFSRRTEHQVAQWCKRYGGGISSPKETLEHAKNTQLGRYMAVNLENYNTIEMRIFRGTLKYNTFIATLQFIDEICNVALLLSDAEIQKLTWLDFVKRVPSERKELISYLKERQLYVNEPVAITEEV